MNHLAQLLAEIVHDIHKLLDPRDLFVVPTTCRYLYDFIKDNQILHKDNYYRVLVWSPLIRPLRGKESVVPSHATSTTHAQDEPPTTNLDWVREIHDVLTSKPSAPATEALSLTLPPPPPSATDSTSSAPPSPASFETPPSPPTPTAPFAQVWANGAVEHVSFGV